MPDYGVILNGIFLDSLVILTLLPGGIRSDSNTRRGSVGQAPAGPCAIPLVVGRIKFLYFREGANPIWLHKTIGVILPIKGGLNCGGLLKSCRTSAGNRVRSVPEINEEPTCCSGSLPTGIARRYDDR
jgi:hypothetical protein